ncbi:arginine and glutamate-rich protein 1-like [Procambarus clarkii]|uniref:arginine and glutamate-rich protein 1-like n=1 Tax=Procambarus clarkii TaxID=6728 RepID=UPI003744782B
MQLRSTMILVLVVWLLVGWARSQHDAPATHERARRAHLKRRMLERLAERGMKMSERESMAEELLARLDYHLASTPAQQHHLADTPDHLGSTTSSTQPFRHKRDHLTTHQRERHTPHPAHHPPSQLIREPPSFTEMQAYAEVYPELEELVEDGQPEVPKIEEVIADVEDEELRRAMEQQFIVAELLEQMRDKRQTPLTPQEIRDRERRRRRQERREERKRKRDEKKGKRNDRKKKRVKLEPRVEHMIKQEEIKLYDEGGEKYIDCCPSKLVIMKKVVGKGRNNRAMDIHAEHQVFYERVCLDEYLGKECIFPVKALRRGTVTRCGQQYSYSQALTRTYMSDEDWKMDMVEVKSGCSCQVSVKRKNKKKKRKR